MTLRQIISALQSGEECFVFVIALLAGKVRRQVSKSNDQKVNAQDDIVLLSSLRGADGHYQDGTT